MLKLLKYEFQKRKKTLTIAAIALATAEVLALYFLNKGGSYTIVSTVIMFIMLFSIIIITFIDVVTHYYNDFKKAQGTMLFSTPNSGYKIVGSKMIFGAIELLSGLLIFILFVWITNSFAVKLGYDGIEFWIENFKAYLVSSFGEKNIWWVSIGFVLLVFIQYTASQTVAVSSITLGRTILSRNSYNWLWAVVIFLAVNIVIQMINGTIIGIVGLQDGLFNITSMTYTTGDELPINVVKYLIVGGIQYIFWIVASFFASSMLLNKKIDI